MWVELLPEEVEEPEAPEEADPEVCVELLPVEEAFPEEV